MAKSDSKFEKGVGHDTCPFFFAPGDAHNMMAKSNLKTMKKEFVRGTLLPSSPTLREAFAKASEESVRPLERDPSGEDFLGSTLMKAWEWTRDAKGESRMATPGPLQHAWFLDKRDIDGFEEPVTVVEAFYQLFGVSKRGFVNDPRSAHYCSQELFVATMKKAFRKRAQQVRSRITILKWFTRAKVEEQSADEAPGEASGGNEDAVYTVGSIIDDRRGADGGQEYKVATALHSTPPHSTLLYSTPLYSTLLHSTPLHSTALHIALHSTALHIALHSTPPHSTPPQSTPQPHQSAPQSTPLHYTALCTPVRFDTTPVDTPMLSNPLHCTPPHCTAAHSIPSGR